MNNPVVILVIAAAVTILALYGFVWAALKYRKVQRRFATVIDIEKERDKISSDRDSLAQEVTKTRANWEKEYAETIAELETLTNQLDQLKDQAEIESFGLYETQYDFEASEQYKERLTLIRDQQKQQIRSGQAAQCSIEWQVEGSVSKGKQMTKRQLKLMLRAFNGECDAAVAKVRYNNVTALKQRIERSFDAINKLGETNRCEISRRYLALKQNELNLAHEYQEKRQAEKEEQRQIREQMREEEKVRREIEKAKQDAEKEEMRYDEALNKAREELEVAGDEKKDKLERQIQELQKRLEEAHTNKERALSRAQMTKSGHVYIISNIGSFGEGIFKIGMTRRLEPMDRVRELGDASVPFAFDVHAMVYSENAPALENSLHKQFDTTRLNLVNNRKEFFRVDLNHIEDAAKKHDTEIEFTRTAQAEEFRKSLSIRAEQSKTVESASPALQVDDAKATFEKRRARWGESSITSSDTNKKADTERPHVDG